MSTAEKELKDLQKRIIGVLRKLSIYWPPKRRARNAAKVQVENGSFLNGKPKYKTMFKCAKCGNLTEKGEMDHIEPVIDPITGFVDWNTYIIRLFVDESGYELKCEDCHHQKSNTENKTRRATKKQS